MESHRRAPPFFPNAERRRRQPKTPPSSPPGLSVSPNLARHLSSPRPPPPDAQFTGALMAKKGKAAAAEAAAPDAGVSSPQGGGGEKEGSFLLGSPTWEDAGGGRWRCKETGHELPEREKEAYGRSRACRLALIDQAVARKKPPLNAFKPHPEHKCVLVPESAPILCRATHLLLPLLSRYAPRRIPRIVLGICLCLILV